MNIFKIKWTEKEIRQWQAAREFGCCRWVLRTGIMAWGSTMFLLWTAGMLYTEGKETMLKRDLVMGMVVWLLCGLLGGLIIWFMTEKSYQKHTENKS